MIIFDLACVRGHRFEGWFGSTGDYDAQRAGGLVRCPVCDESNVEKVPSAKVHVGKSSSSEPVAAKSGPKQGEVSGAVAGVPAELIARLRAMVQGTEDVGRRFPEEARKIHYEETPARPIRGQASADEAEALREEGIEFAPIPAFLTEDTH